MSKSNKEKARIAAIRQYINGEIPFSSDLLKIKLKFNHEAYINSFSSKYGDYYKKIPSQKVEKDVSNKYKELFALILAPLSEKHKMFEITVSIHISVYPNQVLKFIFIYYKNCQLCKLDIGDLEHTKIESEQINLNSFLNDHFIPFKEKYKEYIFLKTVLISNSIHQKKHRNKKERGEELHSIFKKFSFYENINHYMSYMEEKNRFFDLKIFGTNYDLVKNNFKRIFILNNQEKDFIINEQSAFKDNLDILKCLKLMKLIEFDIEGLSEKNILEMYELMNY